MTVSPGKKYIAICERAEKAQCFIFDTTTQRRRKCLVANECESQEYISVAFSPANEKNFLITLSGEPDYMLIFWQWDKIKVLASIKIGVYGALTGTLSCSFNPYAADNIIVVGNGVFRYYQNKDQSEFHELHIQVNNKDQGLGSAYTAHCWLSDARLIIGSEIGEVMVLESSGEFKYFIESSPLNNFKIECIASYSRGFVCCGENGTMYVFEKTEDMDKPYQLTQKVEGKELGSTVMSAVITSTEDQIMYITDQNQLMKMTIALDGTDEESKTDYIIYNFHSKAITGLDVCIRKQMIVTCSVDKTVRIWNYEKKTLEICEQ